jgi:hypothetical protein
LNTHLLPINVNRQRISNGNDKACIDADGDRP